jgi:hypothetical protein
LSDGKLGDRQAQRTGFVTRLKQCPREPVHHGVKLIAGDILARLDEKRLNVLVHGRAQSVARFVDCAIGRGERLPHLPRELDGGWVINLAAPARFDDTHSAFRPEKRHVHAFPGQSFDTEHHNRSGWKLYEVDVVAWPLEITAAFAVQGCEALFEPGP